MLGSLLWLIVVSGSAYLDEVVPSEVVVMLTLSAWKLRDLHHER